MEAWTPLEENGLGLEHKKAHATTTALEDRGGAWGRSINVEA